jgi:glycosyltransferase involved in cell wall biosynthesis
MGHGEARRTGLENCSNDLVALMDADDISRPDRFEKQLRAFEEDPELSAHGGYISEFIGSEDNITGYRIVPSEHREILSYMKVRCPMNQVTVMFRKSHVLRAGGYLDWYNNEDYYLWLRMYQEGMKFGNIPEVLVNVRIGEEMYQRRGGWKYFSSEARLQKYMLEKRIIDPVTYLMNIMKRLIVQVLLPNRLRGVVFRRIARRSSHECT